MIRGVCGVWIWKGCWLRSQIPTSLQTSMLARARINAAKLAFAKLEDVEPVS